MSAWPVWEAHPFVGIQQIATFQTMQSCIPLFTIALQWLASEIIRPTENIGPHR